MKTYIARIWEHISNKQKRHLAFLALLMLAGACTEIFSLGLVVPFLAVIIQPEKVFFQEPFATFFCYARISNEQSARVSMTLLFIFGVMASGFTRVALLWAQTRIGNAIGSNIGSVAYEKTLYQPYLKHVHQNSSEIIATLQTKVNTMVYFVAIPFLTLVTSIFIGMAILLMAAWLQPVATISVGLIFAGIYVGIWKISKKRIQKNGQIVKIQQTIVIQKIMEGLGAIRDVLLDGSQVQYVRDYRLADTRLRQSYGNLAIFAGLPRPILESSGLVILAGTAFFLMVENHNTINTLQVVGVMALTSQKMLPLIQQVYSSWVSMNGGLGCLKDVLELLEQPMTHQKIHIIKNKNSFRKEICFKHVSFRYSDNMPWVLDQLSFAIPKGSRVGFVGKTGSGKSTCLDLLMGLLQPTKGRILIDDTPLVHENLRAWQHNIAHVPQAIYLADTSLAENIAFGVPPENIDIKRVRDVALQAHIADFIESTPQGYNALVGERGIRLSGGQRQRIGIARALYKQSEVLIFDEATSALDGATEYSVMEAIHSLSPDLTVMIVAHRVTTLKGCDQILELSSGKIERMGTYQTIINNQTLPRWA